MLDISDPLFNSQRTTPPKRIIDLGKSTCSYSEAYMFIEHTRNQYSRAKYSVFRNNCQDFAAMFSSWLRDGCTVNTDTVNLDEYFTQLIGSCSPDGNQLFVLVIISPHAAVSLAWYHRFGAELNISVCAYDSNIAVRRKTDRPRESTHAW